MIQFSILQQFDSCVQWLPVMKLEEYIFSREEYSANLKRSVFTKIKKCIWQIRKQIIYLTTERKKLSLNLNVSLTIKYSSTVMQDKRKSCDGHSWFFLYYFFLPMYGKESFTLESSFQSENCKATPDISFFTMLFE